MLNPLINKSCSFIAAELLHEIFQPVDGVHSLVFGLYGFFCHSDMAFFFEKQVNKALDPLKSLSAG